MYISKSLVLSFLAFSISSATASNIGYRRHPQNSARSSGPSKGAIVNYMEVKGQLTWAPIPGHEGYAELGVFDDDDYDAARKFLSANISHASDSKRDLQARAPVPKSGSDTIEDNSGNSHLFQWFCKTPYDYAWEAAETLGATYFCTYVDAVIGSMLSEGRRNTIIRASQQQTAPGSGGHDELIETRQNRGRFRHFLIVVERKVLFPAFKTLACDYLLDVISSLICYAVDYNTGATIKNAAVGGEVDIYDTTSDSSEVIGTFNLEFVEESSS